MPELELNLYPHLNKDLIWSWPTGTFRVRFEFGRMPPNEMIANMLIIPHLGD